MSRAQLTDYQLKADSAEICSSDRLIEGSLDQAVIEGSHHLPGHLAEEHDQEDVPGGDGDTWHQRHGSQLLGAETKRCHLLETNYQAVSSLQ